MPQKLYARHCPTCDRGVIGVKNAPSHLLHLILALVTFGLWIPIWILLTLLAATSMVPEMPLHDVALPI
ncbi:hypothetical protein ACUN0C_19630 [Faunimonas sp. B44]|uniref:hypothetical protein n=1 Tax=Faunimonas sp. B44 TaxID=3461493 RepID=UPI004043FD88